MNIVALVPSPDAIPVHWGWLRIFHLATFFLHLLCMNVMLGGSLIACFEVLGNPSAKPGEGEYRRTLFQHLPFAAAFAVNAGVAPLLFLQTLYGNLIYTSSILMGAYWLSVIGALLIAYYGAYFLKYRYDALGALRLFPAILVPLLLLYIAFVFTSNMALMQQPAAWDAYFTNPGGTMLPVSDPTLPPRFFHFVTASVAVAGLFTAAFWSLGKRKATAAAERHVRRGMRYYIGATWVQMAVGLWLLWKHPGPVRGLMLGGDPLVTALLVFGLLSGFAGIVLAWKRRVWATVWVTLASVGFMVGLREAVRTAYLAPYFTLDSIPVQPQYGPLAVFILALAAGAAAIIHMLRLNSGTSSGRMDTEP
ncbi:MAG: hypothetical protein ACOZF0_08650 [Thermodesulfobacteriota bacterium]